MGVDKIKFHGREKVVSVEEGEKTGGGVFCVEGGE